MARAVLGPRCAVNDSALLPVLQASGLQGFAGKLDGFPRTCRLSTMARLVKAWEKHKRDTELYSRLATMARIDLP